MIISNELVNKLIRLGESHATFSLHPRVEDIVDTHGRLKQEGPRIPLLDAIRALLVGARRLYPDIVHPSGESGLSVSKDLWEALVISLERIDPPQTDLDDAKPNKIKEEVKDAKLAYQTAQDAISALAKDPKLTMDDYVKVLSKSPNAELSAGLLSQAGPENSGWISADGRLPPLKSEFPETLAPKRDVEVMGYVRNAFDNEGVALIEICEYRDEHTRNLLQHHGALVPMSFDKDEVERDDLVAIQYHRQPVWFRASAICAVAPRYARKTSLSLNRILMRRTDLDEWHSNARQLKLPFEENEG
jgi:hypothetical protein